MKYLLIVLSVVVLVTSCAKFTGQKGDPGGSCTVNAADDGSTVIKCPDGSETKVSNGADGKDGNSGTTGAPGNSGTDGHSTVFTVLPADSLQCSDGGSVILLALDINDNHLLDTEDSNLQSAIICNGSKGDKGDTGAVGPSGTPGKDASSTPFTPVKLIAPCTNVSSPFKEQLLCLSGGSILASFSDNANGKNTRFSLLVPGTYEDTDSSGCVFNVTQTSIGLSVNWSAGHNQYGTWSSGNELCK